MESKFEQLMQKYGIVSEKNETSLQTANSLPGPGTEVKFKPNASSHPFVKSKGREFQEKVAQYIADNKKKTKKYRLLITAVNTIRAGSEYASEAGGPLGYLATLVENHGTHNSGHFEVPLDVLEVVNASWNANGAEIPDDWRYDTEKYSKFAQAIKGYWTDGRQPAGSVAAGQK
jgi:hypothetical protein